MKKIKLKVIKDIKRRTDFNNLELKKRELLAIRKTSVLCGTQSWVNTINTLNNFGSTGNITKIRNLCKHTGRTKGILRTYGLSRMEWRRWADTGNIPGVRRASW